MSWTIGSWEFQGPFEKACELESRDGLYVVLCGHDEIFEVYEIGLSSDIKAHIENNSLYAGWMNRCQGRLCIAVFYSGGKSVEAMQAIKKSIEHELIGE
ncbi:MAG: hypothetical protein K2X93_00355 [Candidatus Obscuribacterales bacterium]|nr:hypothetical protein [Candidatus Obscuribacterales bacterium]